MMSPQRVRGTAGLVSAAVIGAGVLGAALAGCGTQVASSASAAGAAGSQPSTTAQLSGCASVNQATVVNIRRAPRMPTSGHLAKLDVTQRKPALVRALFRDFCQVVTHPDTPKGPIMCPADFGLSYAGTFYAGTRPLATFVYIADGCAKVSVTAGGKTRSSMVFGTAAKAAPNMNKDLAAAANLSPSQVTTPPVMVNPGGPIKRPVGPARS